MLKVKDCIRPRTELASAQLSDRPALVDGYGMQT